MKIRLFVLLGLALWSCKTPKPARETEPLPEKEPAATPATPGKGGGQSIGDGDGAAVAPSAAPVTVPAPVAERVELVTLLRGLERPVDLGFVPGDRHGSLYVVEQRGRIRIVRGGKLLPSPFLDISSQVSRGHEEQGLLGLAFHPRYPEDGRFYVNYTDLQGATRVIEYRVAPDDPDRARAKSAREIFSHDQPWRNHNGGHLEFGPDGRLYVGTGDGGSAGDPLGSGQDPESLLGKMLRFDVDEEDPAPEIVALGLRNPWRYAFDRESGDLFIADVGQNKYEWVHVVPAGNLEGKNFGWNIVEGSHCFEPREGCDRSGLATPAVEYSHEEGCSITGGRIYRGKAIPAIRGAYFYADYCTALLRSFRWSAGAGAKDHWDWKEALDPDHRLATISSFGEDAEGELYVLSLGGSIYKLVPRSGD